MISNIKIGDKVAIRCGGVLDVTEGRYDSELRIGDMPMSLWHPETGKFKKEIFTPATDDDTHVLDIMGVMVLTSRSSVLTPLFIFCGILVLTVIALLTGCDQAPPKRSMGYWFDICLEGTVKGRDVERADLEHCALVVKRICDERECGK